jgi:hypothetical protein
MFIIPTDKAGEERRPYVAASVLIVVGACISLGVSAPSWQLLMIYFAVGAFVGILDWLGWVASLVGFVILAFGVSALADVLARQFPNWHSAWWQPVVIAVASSVLVFGLLYFNSRRAARTAE